MIDPRSLRPALALRILNSSRVAPAIDERRFRAHMDLAGHRVGDGRRVDLPRYVAWSFRELVAERSRGQRREPPPPASDAYERHRDRQAREQAAKSRSARDIGPIPPVRDPERRENCRRSFRLFCETYLAAAFPLAWSADHLKVIRRIETSVLDGGLFAFAMPRGSGKTTLVVAACLWAVLYGFRRYIALLGCSKKHAKTLLDAIKSQLEHNELLLADFPEVCFPVRRLERIPQRAGGQLSEGRPTVMHWGRMEVTLPTIEGSAASASRVEAAGLTSEFRGMQFTRTDGSVARPDFVITDDPQTDESARSPSQCDERVRLLSGAVLGLAGPGKKISGFMPTTVIRAGDMADRILDRTKHPEWQGERMKLVYRWPDDPDGLWARYADLRRESLTQGGDGRPATSFYRKNKKAMDAGAEVAWPARKNDDELSALQHAWNLRIDRKERAFFAEFQNEPMPEEETATASLLPDDVSSRVNRLRRGEAPAEASTLTAFIDVQNRILVWLVAAWEPDFTGYVLDYGAWPDQGALRWSRSDPKRSLQDLAPGAGFEATLAKGLEQLCDQLLARRFPRVGGGELTISRCLIDASWGQSIDTVKPFCRASRWANVLTPSIGKFFGPTTRPIYEYPKKRGDRVGLRWRIAAAASQSTPHVLVDTNYWKSFVAQRIQTTVGDRGALTLWGASRELHTMYGEHLTAERCDATTARGRTVDVWTCLPGRENDLLDCTVGAAVAASMQGVKLDGVESEAPRRRRKITLGHLWSHAS